MPRATNRRTPRRRPNLGARPYNPDKCASARFAVGPYDLSTIRLPGGSELEALSLGYVREDALDTGRREGTASATQAMKSLVERSNQLLVKDSSNAYTILQPSIHGPFARSINMTTLRSEFDAELKMGGLPSTLTEAQFKHQLDAKLNMARGQSAFKGLPGDHNYRPTDPATGQQANLYIARTGHARNSLPQTYVPMRIK